MDVLTGIFTYQWDTSSTYTPRKQRSVGASLDFIPVVLVEFAALHQRRRGQDDIRDFVKVNLVSRDGADARQLSLKLFLAVTFAGHRVEAIVGSQCYVSSVYAEAKVGMALKGVYVQAASSNSRHTH